MTRTIIRAARRHRFTTLDTRVIEDARLSWAARGVLAYLLSRPDNWRVIAKDLQRRGDLGRDGVYGVLRELREAGYIRFQRVRDPAGRVTGACYFVSEEPAYELHSALPEEAQPDSAKPDPAVP